MLVPGARRPHRSVEGRQSWAGWTDLCSYFAVSKGGKGGVAAEALKDPEVCTDPSQLTTHAMGVNIYKEGQEVALKPDSEYPTWLFQVDLGPPKKLEDLEPESREYWRLLRKQNIWRHNRLSKNKKL